MRLTVLITGAASGIGRATAETLQKMGHHVIALDKQPIENGLSCDITNEHDLNTVREQLENENVFLDVILCAAGIHDTVSLVESEEERFRKLINVNLTGTILTCRTFHPLLKKNGRIVIVTSEVAPLAPLPFNGLYNVTKTALNAYAQALRQELNLLGQKVITIQPGAIKTPLCDASVKSIQSLAEKTVLFQKQASKFSAVSARFMGTPAEPEKIAKIICRAVLSKHPKLTYHKHRNPGLLLLNLFPLRFQCFLIKLILQ